MVRSVILVLSAVISIGVPVQGGLAQDSSLARYFGFGELEILKIGRGAGPIEVADVDGDGLNDLVVVNNRASRVEIHHQRRGASADDPVVAPSRVNEFPEHWRFRRELISVTHRVTAVVLHDFDGDGLLDLIYAGLPAEIVFVRQTEPGAFETTRRHRVKDLAASRDGLLVADLLDDAAPELIALVDGAIHIWPLDGDSLGPVQTLAAGGDIVALLVEDFNGDDRLDIAGVIPDDPAPIRLWLGDVDGSAGVIGAQQRFELPPLRECTAVRLRGEDAARLAVIERVSKRVVLYAVTAETIAPTGDREVAISSHSFTDPDNRKRDHAVVDLNGDGLLDLVATDNEANAIVTYVQVPGKGLQSGVTHPSLSDLTYLVAGNVDDDPAAEIFVLSEQEGVVGRCDAGPDGVPFPRPLRLSAGLTPTALNLVELEHGPHLAVVAKDGRDYVLDLIEMDGDVKTVTLGKLSRSPETIVALDADQDGRTDLLLFMRDKPMMMLRSTEEGFTLTESKDMGQYGLVKSAKAENIAALDVDGDGRAELLIAAENFVRAVRYEPETAGGLSPGWQVVKQINARDSSSKLVSIAILEDRIIAADQENDRLVVMQRRGAGTGEWAEAESLGVRGFRFSSIHAGGFSGNGGDNILAIGEDGFAVIQVSGERVALRELAAWRTTDEQRMEHELAYGDVNGDGYTDMIALDAGEQMCEIFTFTERGEMLYATGFQVFESRLFSGGNPREFEPSEAIVADVTGDGADDLVLLAHDRVLIYPQMTE